MLQGQFTVGMILAFQGYLSQFMAPASTLTSVMQTLQEMRTDMERIEDVMRYPDDPAFSPGSARPRRIVREAQGRRAYGGRDLRILEVGRTPDQGFRP